MQGVPHFSNDGPELLLNGNFADNGRHWRLSPGVGTGPDGLVLGGQGSGTYTVSQVFAAPPGTLVEMAATLVLQDVVRGTESWQSARVELFGRSAGGPWRWDFDNTLLKATGSIPRHTVRRVFELPQQYDEFKVEAHLVGASGTLRVQALSLTSVTPAPFVHTVCQLLGLVWLLAAGFCIRAARQQSGLPGLPGLAPLALVTLLFVPSPRDFFLNAFADGSLPAFGVTATTITLAVEGLAHACIFLACTLLLLRLLKPRAGIALLTLPLFAAVLEVLQHLTNSRQVELMDAAVNVSATLVAICWWYWRLSARVSAT